jgi:ParB-like chromosome segregation protein Spo0J
MQRAAIGTILPNPSNPRIIKDDKFKKLVKSIQEFPEMLELRPIVVDGNMVVLGGNMRLKACIAAGLKEVPIIVADNLTDAQKGEFIIKDNVGFGEWDWDLLANEWEPDALIDWGLDLPILMDEPSYDELIGDEKGNPATMKITFDSPEQLQKAEIDIQELLDRKYQGAYFSVSAGGI